MGHSSQVHKEFSSYLMGDLSENGDSQTTKSGKAYNLKEKNGIKNQNINGGTQNSNEIPSPRINRSGESVNNNKLKNYIHDLQEKKIFEKLVLRWLLEIELSFDLINRCQIYGFLDEEKNANLG